MIKTNAAAVIDSFNDYEGRFRQALKRLVTDSTMKCLREAKKEAPVRTGFLRKNIIAHDFGFAGVVESKASYSGFVHDGTRFQKPNPFLSRARASTIAWLRAQRLKI